MFGRNEESWFVYDHSDLEKAKEEGIAEERARNASIIEHIKAELSIALEERATAYRKMRDHYVLDGWLWLGDGTDKLDCMSEGMLIGIRAGDMRSEIAKAVVEERACWEAKLVKLQLWIDGDGPATWLAGLEDAIEIMRGKM